MKKFSRTIRAARELDNEIGKFKEDMDVLITSERFINEFRGYIEDIARFKTANGKKFFRSTDYAAIGIMDSNDVYQEAYLAFFEAYNNLDWDKVGQAGEDAGAVIWGFLKKSTVLNLEKGLRKTKDGIRVPERALFGGDAETNFLTKLFSRLEVVFDNNVEYEVGLTKWETDLIGSYLEVHMDEFLDLTREGNRDFKKKERDIMKALYGIDQPVLTYKEVSELLKINQSTIRKVKERALTRLKSTESKYKIAHFLNEYRISTKANVSFIRK